MPLCWQAYRHPRENRLALKEKMLQEVWGETLPLAQEDYEQIKLKLADGLQEKMDRELILLEDVKKVIHYAQTTGNRLLDKNTGRYISYLQEVITDENILNRIQRRLSENNINNIQPGSDQDNRLK